MEVSNERALAAATAKWNRKIITQTRDKIEPELSQTLIYLRKSFLMFENEPIGSRLLRIKIPHKLKTHIGHGQMTGLMSDMGIIGEIRNVVELYFCGIYMAVDGAQKKVEENSWTLKEFNTAMSSIEAEVNVHTDDIYNLILKYRKTFAPDPEYRTTNGNYDDLLVSAAKLWLRINSIVNNTSFSKHLTNVMNVHIDMLRREEVK